MNAAPDPDVVVVGAGHNGLAATALLAKLGFRVLCLEKNAFAGGMAGFLCGASCHPGPGVIFLPGYGAAYEVAEALASEPARPQSLRRRG